MAQANQFYLAKNMILASAKKALLQGNRVEIVK
jgi:hypothetical protein